MSGPAPIEVRAEHTYDVVVGRDLLDRLPTLVGDRARRALLVHPRALAPTVARVRAVLEDAGLAVHAVEVPDAEDAKTAAVLAHGWEVLGRAALGREDVVVGVGGGATTDLAGFLAATWLRGVRVVQVPTTLLGMVDAAVGGKTGINTAEGKNLVGAFHSPAGVLCDLQVLRTLPRADLVAGLAEVIKCGFVADPRILELVEAGPEQALDPTGDTLAELVRRAVQVKADVVSVDLKESGLREVLNYGHTLGHAIEHAEGYRWRHGEAVAVGMVYAAELAAGAGVLDPAVVTRHREVLTSVGLPIGYRGDRWPQLLDAMRRDKKTRGDLLRFVVLEDVARPTRLEGPDPDALVAAYAAIGDPGAPIA